MREFGFLVGPDGKKWRMRTETGKAGSFGRKFMQVFPDELLELAADRATRGAALRVLMWAWANLAHERWGLVSQARIAEEISLGASTVGHALAHLAERGFLERRGSGPRQEWRLTTRGGWCGTASSYQRARRERGDLDPATGQGGGAGLVLVHDADEQHAAEVAEWQMEQETEPAG